MKYNVLKFLHLEENLSNYINKYKEFYTRDEIISHYSVYSDLDLIHTALLYERITKEPVKDYIQRICEFYGTKYEN